MNRVRPLPLLLLSGALVGLGPTNHSASSGVAELIVQDNSISPSQLQALGGAPALAEASAIIVDLCRGQASQSASATSAEAALRAYGVDRAQLNAACQFLRSKGALQ